MHHQNFRFVVAFCTNVYTFSPIENIRYYFSLLRLFILTFSMSGFSSIYLPLLIKPIICVLLVCFKCEITKILRCLGILNGLVLSRLNAPDLPNAPWTPVPFFTGYALKISQVLFFKTWQP